MAMAKDHYSVLGVGRDATEQEIRDAYRRLARKLHPDVNKAPDAQQQFTELQQAYDVLSDEKKRAQYDRFGHAEPGRHQQVNVNFDDLGSIFETMFGGGGRAGPGARAREPRHQPRPRASEADLFISFRKAVEGGIERVRMSDGKTIEVAIPKGVASGQKLRVRGAGTHGGDLIFRVDIGEHPLFKRSPEHPLDLYLELPLNLVEATLGATVEVPTMTGEDLSLRIPAGTASGRKLRLKGRGIEDAHGKKGDLYALIRIVPPSPESLTDEERSMLQALGDRLGHPRASWESAP
ncbi:MAG: DnaJ domain-containing protein [Phycisphaerales bacterium]|nr:DnaJ domain-containing protein [Phycisphaerales bacterium]